jgi:Ca-activated chloride channel homolog
MENNKYTYRLKWIVSFVILGEVLFFTLFFILNHLFGWSLINDSVTSFGDRIRYENQSLLVALFILPILALLFVFNLKWRNKVLHTNFSFRLREKIIKPFSSLNTFTHFFLFRNALAFLIIALANPQFGNKQVGGKAESMEIIVALDISKSMLVTDIDGRKKRLRAAKNGINQLINQLHGDKIGLVVFAGMAYPQLGLTSDYAAAKLFVNEVTTDMITNQGTNIPDALELALKSFSNEKTAKTIILITDGENHEGDLTEIMAAINEKQITVHCVGLGSSKGGPIPSEQGGFKKDEEGHVVVSKLNEEMIKDIANQGKGTFVIESSAYPNFKALIDATSRMERATLDSKEFKVSQQYGTFFTLLSLLFFISSIVWSTSRWGWFNKLSNLS